MKLRSKCGETLVETLLSILIILLTFLFLTTAVITAAKINAKVKSNDISFHYEQGAGTEQQLVITGDTVTDREIVVKLHETENGYVYYNE